MKDPLHFIQTLFADARLNGTRLISFLSDDGARTTRYAPFFANSGFFYLTAVPENVYFAYSVMAAFDILKATGSHQNVFTYRLMERMDMTVMVKPQQQQFKNRFMSLHQFPSGVKYHHDKAYMAKITSRAIVPYIFHM